MAHYEFPENVSTSYKINESPWEKVRHGRAIMLNPSIFYLSVEKWNFYDKVQKET
jgi:hypothetical protein